MEMTLNIPEEIAGHPNAARELLEEIAVQAYEQGKFSSEAAGALLGMGRIEFLGLLSAKGVSIYSRERWEEDLKILGISKHAELAAK